MGYSVTIGYFEDGQPGEVFVNGAKVGSLMAAVLGDGAILVSLALQHGISPDELAKSMSRLPSSMFNEASARPASPIAAAVDLLVSL